MPRAKKSSGKLSDIVDEKGLPFSSSDDRNNYLVEFYGNLYKKHVKLNDFSGCIESFLGPEICCNPVVRDSIIPLYLKNELEAELTLEELDSASKEANKKSAPGPDGLSMNFIQKYWIIFRVPLLKYAHCCFKKGLLTSTFRMAHVRLIPKKDDSSNVKKWRPISLLSNLYKVISRALNNRLKKTVDFVTSRAQKGFTSSRHLQEVLMNVVECIGHCNATGTEACIVSVDMAKAFDTLDHDFLHECYNFFGFGKKFINMMETVGNNRMSCIILENNELSKPFKLNTGRPQGEVLSPGQYNIGNQILLFRLELDSGMASVFQHMVGPARPYPLGFHTEYCNTKFKNELNRETDKTEGFVDDTSVIIKRTNEGIKCLKTILTEFSKVSGLNANLQKTQIMAIGDLTNLEVLNNAGMTVVDEITLLGMKSDNKIEKLHDNFEVVLKKVLGIVYFWERFNLSLPGRILIAKTFLLSQINHIGAF